MAGLLLAPSPAGGRVGVFNAARLVGGVERAGRDPRAFGCTERKYLVFGFFRDDDIENRGILLDFSSRAEVCVEARLNLVACLFGVLLSTVRNSHASLSFGKECMCRLVKTEILGN